MIKMIDAHIHLDQYRDDEISEMVSDVSALISVSTDLISCRRNLELSKRYSAVKPAFGLHPEQPLPNEMDIEKLQTWMIAHKDEAVAIGEVGLPYYLKQEKKLNQPYDLYVEYLESFIKIAKQLNKPIVLHAVYDDAHIVCDLLEKHTIKKAHFHWFKGGPKAIERLIENEFFISITPDVIYRDKIQALVEKYPLELMMVETDGPYPFNGPFAGKRTRPKMMHDTIKKIAQLKQLPLKEVYTRIYDRTNYFYIVK